MTPKVAVIVLNFQGRRWLEDCFATLSRTEYESLQSILVDNASTDGSVETLRQQFPSVEVICNQVNYGFAEGNNIGIRGALTRGVDYVVLLNPDTRVTPHWLRELIEVGESDPRIGIIGAVQMEYGTEDLNSWTATAFPSLLEELRSAETARRSIPVEWVEGACFAVKRRVFEEIGLLDPIYYAFYEEIDFCRRALLRGWEVVLAPRSRIHHFRGGTWAADPVVKRERDYRCDRSQFIFTLTEPRRTLLGNLGWYFITLATKGKHLLKSFSLERAWDLGRMQVDVLSSAGALFSKWQRDRKETKRRRPGDAH